MRANLNIRALSQELTWRRGGWNRRSPGSQEFHLAVAAWPSYALAIRSG